VGINTGEVVVRSLATSEEHVEYTPIGHSTSLAARMQGLRLPAELRRQMRLADCAKATSPSERSVLRASRG
jgi:class 3 adenylate cyclase